jgi:protein-disulfide isomerase
LPVRGGIVTVNERRSPIHRGRPAPLRPALLDPVHGGRLLDRRPPTPRSRREQRRLDRLTERDAERERARRRATRPAWQSPTALITGAAVVIGLLLFVLLVVRPGTTGKPASSDNPFGFVKPDYTIPAGLANGRSLGKADAPVTMNVWADFQCPFCSQFARLLEPQVISNLVTKGTVRLVAHDFTFIGDESMGASVAARCADRQGKFWEYYQMLFWNQGETENSGAFATDRLLGMADYLKLDHAAFQTCQSDQTLRTEVTKETTAGQALGIQSTPTSIINGTLVLGLKDYATYAALIQSAAASASPAAPSASPATSPSPAASPSGGSAAP